MNVLILGKNGVNETISKRIGQEGHKAITISDLSDIWNIKGVEDEFLGDFSISTKSDLYNVSNIIVTEPPIIDDLYVGEGKAYNIMDDKILDKLKVSLDHKKIVFLLDYLDESPEYIFVKAISMARKLCRLKKEVYFISKFVRTASEGIEKEYREARGEGITFIKFENLNISFDEESNDFNLIIDDGVIETNITTPYVASVGKISYDNLKNFTKKLRLRDYDNGLLNDDRFFLHKVLTSRKGIFYLNPGVTITPSRLDLSVRESLLDKEFGYDAFHNEVNIDKRKCAFCYACYRACPHGAMEPDLENSAMKNNYDQCVACGICVSICPGKAISIEDDLKSEDAQKTKCKFFCCENSGKIAMNEIKDSLGEDLLKISISEVPCGGRISTEMITDALNKYGKVLIAVCMDDACRHFEGGKRACMQLNKTVEMLEKSNIDTSKVKYIKLSHAMRNVLKDNILEFLNN